MYGEARTIRRASGIALALVLAAGCGKSFKDEAEELRYLQTLSNPTLEQFRRREQLQATAAKSEPVGWSSKQLEWYQEQMKEIGERKDAGEYDSAIAGVDRVIQLMEETRRSDLLPAMKTLRAEIEAEKPPRP